MEAKEIHEKKSDKQFKFFFDTLKSLFLQTSCMLQQSWKWGGEGGESTHFNSLSQALRAYLPGAAEMYRVGQKSMS